MAYSPPLTGKLALLVCCLCLIATASRADLVWSPDTGWRAESGALSGLNGREAHTALDLMNRARSAEESGRSGKALSLYAKVVKKYSSSIYAPEALYRIGKLRLAKKEYYAAFDAFQNIATAYPNVRRFNEIVGLQYRIAADLLDGARNHVFGVVPFFRNKERAIKDMEVVVLEAPYGDYAPLALTAAARGREQVGDTEEAIDILDRIINNYNQDVLVPDAYLQLARMHSSLVEGPYYDQDETKQAMTYYEDFMILYPGDTNIGTAATGLDNMRNMLAESKMKIGDFYFYKRDNYTAARVFYNEAITSYPDSSIAKRARQRLAEVDAKAAKAALPPPVKKSPAKKKFWLF
jgi:outer membrane protein assembly factor BamD